MVSQVPLAAGVGGGITQGERSADIARFADAYGCVAVVLNSAVDVYTVRAVFDTIDLPIIYTVISDYQELDEYIEAGVSMLNISGAQKTDEIVCYYRNLYPEIPIIATDGRKDKDIIETLEAGVNAITYTPPTTQAVFKNNMNNYRVDLKEDYEENHP